MLKKIRILIGVAFLLAGIGCFMYPNFREWKTQREVDHIIEAFEEKRGALKNEDEASIGDVSPDAETERPFADLYEEMLAYNQRLYESGQEIKDAWSEVQTSVSLSGLDSGTDAIGYINIPDMKVRLPLYFGTTDGHLENGAAVMAETSLPVGGMNSNCAIAAHRGFRGSAYFQYIENMEIGSKVYLTNYWETLTYEVTDIQVVLPSDVDAVRIHEGRDMVTLISCHPYVIGGGPYRYLVFCDRVKADADPPEETDTDVSQEDGSYVWEKHIFLTDSSNFLEWETLLRTALPVATLLAAVIIVLVRCIRKKRK